MANITIYINKTNELNLQGCESKGKLINELIEAYFNDGTTTRVVKVPVTPSGIRELTYTKVGDQDPWDKPSSPEVFRFDDSKMTTRVIGVR